MTKPRTLNSQRFLTVAKGRRSSSRSDDAPPQAEVCKRIYIAGAIAGEPNPERKFQFAAGLIERMGHIAVNPFTVAPTTDGWTYEQYLIADLHAMLDCDEVVALPCWRRSKGATIEVQLALRLNKPVRFVERDKYDDIEQGG